MTQAIVNRRYDIDWLRTLAFGLLILYHVGMYYVADWGWHVKSEQQSVFLQNLMILTNQWRMSLLFFVSGIALTLTYGKLSATKILAIRSQRLLIPLIFGMLVIVPPQRYYELLQGHDYNGSYINFISEYLDLDTELAPHKQSGIGLLTWNHLWFVPYLWTYSVIALLLLPLLTKCLSNASIQKTPVWIASLIVIVCLALVWVSLRGHFPVTHALLDDWYSHGKYFSVFLAGVCLALLPDLWDRLLEKRRVFAVLAILGYCWITLDRHGLLDVGESLDQLLVIKLIHGLLLSTNHWAWILALVGYAGRYLQFTNRFISYANQAILPWYILHQTLIVVFAVQLKSFLLPVALESMLLIISTVVGCLLGYEIVKRVTLLRWLFGLKVTKIKQLHYQTN
jgi:glucan biosynthesis protein C